MEAVLSPPSSGGSRYGGICLDCGGRTSAARKGHPSLRCLACANKVQAAAKRAQLRERQQQVLELAREGLTLTEIAARMGVDVRTVKADETQMRREGIDVPRRRRAPIKPNADGTKLCPHCGETKPLADFYATRRGYQTYCKPCCSARVTTWGGENPERRAEINRASTRKRKYGLSREQYDEMMRRQAGRCAICNSNDALAVDHCHESGKVRGLLCRPCNLLLGLATEDVDLLDRAMDYLMEHQS